MAEERKVPESFKIYEDGKHRRYSLLFAVDGGAFTVARLFTAAKVTTDAVTVESPVLRHLTLRQLSFGTILFTILMVVDIFMFGEKMREGYLPDGFGWQGKAVLVLVGSLICAGWFLVA